MKRNGTIAVFALLAGVYGCSSDAAPDERTPLLMAGTFSKTGVSAVATWDNAFELAAFDASEGLALAGFPTDKRIKFLTEIRDTKNDIAITVASATEMVKDKGALMVINGTSADTTALGKLAYDDDPDNDIGVPILCVACSSPSLHSADWTSTTTPPDMVTQNTNRNVDKWIFGLAMSSVPQSQVLWTIIENSTPTGNEPGDLNGDGVVKISTIALNDGFGTGFQKAMRDVVKPGDTGRIYEETLHAKDANLDSYDWGGALDLLTDNKTEDPKGGPAVTDVEPDVLIEFTFPQFSLALVKAYSAKIPFLHTHSMREQTVVVAAQNKLEGQEGTSYLPSDGKSGDMFDARFRDIVKKGRQSQWDSDVYDGGFLFGLAAVKATMDLEDPSEVTGEQIRDAMRTLNDPDGEVIRVGPEEFAKAAKLIAKGEAINYEGASGPCDFDAAGRATNRLSHWRVTDGEVENVATYNCVEDIKTCPLE